MKLIRWFFLTILFLAACKARGSATYFILDGTRSLTLVSTSGLPSLVLEEAGLSLAPGDQLLFRGAVIQPEQPLPTARLYTLEIRRSIPIILTSPEGTETIQTTARTVGQVLEEAGFNLFAVDQFNPPAGTPLFNGMAITYQPSREFSITAGNQVIRGRSAAKTIGQALAETGLPLEGLDYSIPPGSEAMPEDGQIAVVRVQEVVNLSQKTIAFKTEFQGTADLELDTVATIQTGENGVAVRRERIRYENGLEVSRRTESETVVRPVQDEIIGFGTRIVIRTAQTPEGVIEYYRTRYVYATSYSPCNSGASRCYPGTSSGKKVTKGVIAVLRSWYYAMRGQPVYVPDYGFATIEDVGAGFPNIDWIDLGYTDAQFAVEGRAYWTTVYFLTPVPASILYFLP